MKQRLGRSNDGPQTDEELWQAVYALTGYKIPRVAVCPNHVAPFQIFADVYFERRFDVLMIGNRGGGKRLALDTPLPTPTGWTTVGEVRPGDTLFDECGHSTQVMDVYPVALDTDAYRVEFSDGAYVIADAEHLWYTEARLPRGGRQKHARRHPGVRTTAQIRDTLMTYAPGEFNHSIPVARPLQLPEQDLPIDPYVLGAWLGDGDSNGGTRLHTNVDEAAFFEAQLAAAGMEARTTAHRGGTASAVSRQVWFKGMRKSFRQLGLLRNKHIPDVYLRASIDQRLALLQGLMDTDGYITKDGKAELITKSVALCRGMMELLRALGYKPTVSEKRVAASGNVARFGSRSLYGPYFRIRFQPYADLPPVRMPHKVARLRSRADRSMSQGRRITAVVPVESVPMRCIRVDSPSHLFLCGEGMVPTHNTTISGFLHGAKCRWKPGYKALIAGATERQSGRAYTEFKRFSRKLAAEIVASLKSLTTWVNDSLLEVIVATMKGVNGPHPHLAQFDEAELSTQQIFEEFQNMAQGDDRYPAQNLLSTTRKFAFGIIQEIVKRCDQALKDGNTPEWDICIFCIFETMQNVPNCGEGCGCEDVIKGRWQEGPLKGQQRTFASVCGGRAKSAQGFVRLEDVHRRFKRLSIDTWEAQQECLQPDPEGLVHRWLRISEHVITSWLPYPEYGDVYRAWDWGGCYDAETEVLTARGWVPWPEATMDDEFASLDLDTELVEFQKPTEIVAKRYYGPMQHWQNRNVDLLVTADHNMLVTGRDQDGGWRLQPSMLVPDSARMTRTSNGRKLESVGGLYGIEPQDWAAILGFWMAEGHTYLGRTGNGNMRQTGQVGWTNTNTTLLSELQEILERYWPYVQRRPSGVVGSGCEQLVINDPALHEHLAGLGKAGTKHLPEYVKAWPKELLDIYMEWHMRGDGNRTPHTTHGGTYTDQRVGRIYTTSKRLADDLQEIAMYMGMAANVVRRPARGVVQSVTKFKPGWTVGQPHVDCYVVGLTKVQARPRVYAKSDESRVRTTLLPEDHGERMVYCAVLPKHHTLYVRRNGKAVWCGNTNPHAVLWCQLLRVPVEHGGRVFHEGELITFDEFYKGEQMSFTDLGIRVAARTEEWHQYGYRFTVVQDICDPAGGVAKRDASNGMTTEGYPEPHWKMRPTPRIESIAKHVEWGQGDRLRIVGPMCPNLLDEYSKAHRPLNREGQPMSEDMAKVDDHALDAQRMLIWHLYKESQTGGSEAPVSNRDTKVTKQDKRPGMRGALGAPIRRDNTLPKPGDYLQDMPFDPGAPDLGRAATRRGLPTGSSKSRSTLKRARVPR